MGCVSWLSLFEQQAHCFAGGGGLKNPNTPGSSSGRGVHSKVDVAGQANEVIIGVAAHSGLRPKNVRGRKAILRQGGRVFPKTKEGAPDVGHQ